MIASIARELAELTGETNSQLHQWASQHSAIADVSKAKQTFYNWMDKSGWKRSTSKTLTQDCHLSSHPLSCRLRLRAVTWIAQFQRDARENSQRQMVLLLGYEPCSRLLHFQLFRGMDHPIDLPTFPLCNEVPVAPIASFVEECAQMVGLPIQHILFTQRLFPFPDLAGEEQAYLSLTHKRLVVRKRGDTPDDDELLCGFAVDPPCKPIGLVASPTLPIFAEWFRSSNSTALTEKLSTIINHHNELNALPRLAVGRERLDALKKTSIEKNPPKVRGWGARSSIPPPFQARLARHNYLGETKTLEEVRFFRRHYRNFDVLPGDSPSKASVSDTGD